MRFKHLPEDFVVEEQSSFVSEDGPFHIYRMSKTNLATMDALRKIVEHCKLEWHDISSAGLKDKKAQTTQLICIAKDVGKQLDLNNLMLEKVGCSKRKLEMGDLESNRFTITLRDIGNSDRVVKTFESLTSYPNYFDSQRFGSAKHQKGFFAKEIVKKNYEKALMLHLATPTGSEKDAIAQMKKLLFKEWGNWKQCLTHVPNHQWETRKILEMLVKHPTEFLSAIRLIEKKMRVLYLFTYQSYLFNMMLDAYVRTYEFTQIQYELGALAMSQRLPNKTLALVSKKAQYTQEFQGIVKKTLTQEGFQTIEEIKMPKHLTDTFFKANERSISVVPTEKKVLSVGRDECFPGRYKVVLQFVLPKGAYATLYLKYLEVSTFR